MKAIICSAYGSPEVLQLKEVEKPKPTETEVLIHLHATAVNPLDWRRMRAEPFLVRLSEGLFRPTNMILGADIAGRVAAVGEKVTDFRIGDFVFGEISMGGFAEYVSVAAEKLVLVPENLTCKQAAAVPVAALSALQGLRKGEIQAGQQVLINGASGGVGTFAVQMAKAFGAEVTGVCSARNAALVRSIGADHVIDYTQEDFTTLGQQYDLIYDAVGNYSVAAYQRALRPEGRCVVVGFTTVGHLFQVILLGAWRSKRSRQQIGLLGMAQPNKEDMLTIIEMLKAGQITPVIDREFPLAEAAEAIRYVETKHARGKVIITMAANNVS